MEFQLDGVEKFDVIPTNERIERAAKETPDIGLSKMLFDYGRYLLISCSRPGGLPATLQGIWNQDFTPPWESKYTININTEMNYWLAESCNLSECHMPLFDLLERMVENGRRTAEKMYGCRGFVAHHNTDIHGDTAPQDTWYPATYWVMCCPLHFHTILLLTQCHYFSFLDSHCCPSCFFSKDTPDTQTHSL